MTTRTKRNVASLTASVMMFLSVFSHPLGISEAAQWVLMTCVFVPLALVFYYSKKLKAERANAGVKGAQTLSEISAAQKKIKARIILAWVISAACGLATPLWLPITGVSNGPIVDSITGVITAVVVSVIFGIRLKIISNQRMHSTPSGRE